MDNSQKNKYLAEKMGVEWHKWDEKADDYICACGAESGSAVFLRRHIDSLNPDYFSLSGRQELLEWAVEQEWWGDFFYADSETAGEMACIVYSLLIPVPALAEAAYTYLKEQDNG
ncbi:MAG: hypothetical protein V3R78_10275 [Thermodesulfobacteriota bacterium]